MDQFNATMYCTGCIECDLSWDTCPDNRIGKWWAATVRNQDEAQLCVMACRQRRLAKCFERKVGLRGIVEVEQVDFPRRVESDVGPACSVFGSVAALMYPHFADGDIHFIIAAGRCIGHRHA